MEEIGFYLLWYLSGLALLMICALYLFNEIGVMKKKDMIACIYFSIISGHLFALFFLLIYLTNGKKQL